MFSQERKTDNNLLNSLTSSSKKTISSKSELSDDLSSPKNNFQSSLEKAIRLNEGRKKMKVYSDEPKIQTKLNLISGTSNLTIQRLKLGTNQELDTQNDNHKEQIIGYLKSQDYNTLLSIRANLDSTNAKDFEFITFINYHLNKTDALNNISASSHQFGKIFTSATIFFNKHKILETEPIMANDSSTIYYQKVLDHNTATETELEEEHNSRNDSEISTLEQAYNLLAEYHNKFSEYFNANTQIHIVISGTSGPCNGCKKRLEQFQSDILSLLSEGSSLTIESNYINSTSIRERNNTPTRYGYTDQTAEKTAYGSDSYSYQLPN